jgi:hypothetical protein
MQTITSERVSELFTQLRPVLGERDWRLVGAAVAQLLGRGGVSAVARGPGRDAGPSLVEWRSWPAGWRHGLGRDGSGALGVDGDR